MSAPGSRHHISPDASERLAYAARQANASRVTANAGVRAIRQAERPDLGEALALLDAASANAGLAEDQLRIHR
jgi:hypothetical protein